MKRFSMNVSATPGQPQERAAGTAGILAGLALGIGTLVLGGFTAAAAGQRLLDVSRPELTKSAVQSLRVDFDKAVRAAGETQSVIVPTYATAENMTTDQFVPVFLSRYPAVAKASQEGPGTIQFTDKAIKNLEHRQADF